MPKTANLKKQPGPSGGTAEAAVGQMRENERDTRAQYRRAVLDAAKTGALDDGIAALARRLGLTANDVQGDLDAARRLPVLERELSDYRDKTKRTEELLTQAGAEMRVAESRFHEARGRRNALLADMRAHGWGCQALSQLPELRRAHPRIFDTD